MTSTKSLTYKICLLMLALCCLTNVYAAKITKSKTKAVAAVATTTAEDVTTSNSVIKAVAANDDDTDSKDSPDSSDNADEDDDDDDDDDSSSEETTDDPAEKNAVQPAAATSLSVWGIVRGVWNWIKEDISEGLFGGDDDTTTSAVGEGRTFGKIRRLQMALIPIIFKFGILTAMVAFLVAIALKTFFLVKVLLAMNVLVLLGKFFTLKSNLGHYEHVAAPNYGWNPHGSTGWASAPAAAAVPHPSKEIHLHIHGGQGQPQVQSYSTYGAQPQQSHGWDRSTDPYSAYESLALQGQNDVTNTIPETQQTNAEFPANHRMF